MLPTLISLLTLVMTPTGGAIGVGPDSDLQARFQQVAGARVRLEVSNRASDASATDAPVAPQAVQPPACPTRAPGLCQINWGSAPPVFVPLSLPDSWQAALGRGDAQVLLRSEAGAPLVVVGRDAVLLAFQTTSSDPGSAGARLRRWPYFNYLLQCAASAAAGATPPSFASFPLSLLPDARGRALMGVALVAAWLLALLLYRAARAAARRRSDAATQFLAAIEAARGNGDGATAAAGQGSARGDVLPFSRPLSGLLTLLANMLLLIGPYFALQSLLARRVQPFPEADGLWRTTTDALYIVWMTFDLGTQTAFVKYFAEHRASPDPATRQRALSDVQFYIWFQVFSRLVEATGLVALALGYLPMSSYALYAPLVVLYAATCQPAFPAIGKFLCQATQRFDYYNLLDFLESRLLSFLVPVPFILAGRAWGQAHPAFGEAYGAAIGMGLGGLANSLVVLAMGLYALSRLRLPVRSLFMAHFDRDTVRRQLWFGFKLTVGQEPFRLTSFLESLIIIRWLRDFPTWLGIRDLLHNRLTFLYFFAWSFYQSALPAVSEAFSTGKRALVQYYVGRYLQLGTLFSVTVFSLLIGIGPFYIRGALGGQWAQAESYLLIASLSGLLLPWAWLTDALQQGAGRPGTTTAIMLVEQGLRLSLLLLLVPRFQFIGIYMAALSALVIKCAAAWAWNHRSIVPLRVAWRGTIGAPLLVAICNFLLWRGVTAALLWLGWSGAGAAIALFFVAGAGSMLFCFFLMGLCGGIDPTLRQELAQAVQLSAVLRPVCHLLAGAAAWGARLSPLSPSPPPMWEQAQQEAAQL